jgi:hypothetical protein
LTEAAATLTDGTAVWRVENYATIEGTLLEDVATQKLLNSDAPATQTTASLGVGNYTLSVYGTGSALASGGTATISGAASATDGNPDTFSVDVAGTVTVTVTGSLDYFQLESGDFPTSIIITAGSEVTRAATTLSDTTSGRLTPESGAGMVCLTQPFIDATATSYTLFSSFTDNDNYIWLRYNTSNIQLLKNVAGSLTVITDGIIEGADKPYCVDFYYDSTGMGVRAYNVGESTGSFVTSANSDAVTIGTTFEIGSLNGGTRLDMGCLNLELSTDREDFGS